MKIGILVINIVLPMLASIGLYCYAFASSRWNYIDYTIISQHSSIKQQQDFSQSNDANIQLVNQTIRHAFRSRYGLFGYCLDYKWLTLRTFKSNTTLLCPKCNESNNQCAETSCCMKRCDHIPDCPSYSDEAGCNRRYNDTRYYWKAGNCIWRQMIPFDYQTISHYFSSTSRDIFSTEHICYYIMLVLFLLAPLLTFLALLILFCINCMDRFYSIPFAFVSLFSLASFLSGAGGLGIFLYEWINVRVHPSDFNSTEVALNLALNPWIVNVEQLGLAFWIAVAAIGTNLFTTILSCCFCCGLQSNKSIFRLRIKNEKYAIIHTNLYDD